MSDDITGQIPPDGERDTPPMLRQILAEVREVKADVSEFKAEMLAFRVEVGGRLDRLERDLAEFKIETRQGLRDLDRTLAASQRDNLRRYVDLEERVDKLEGEGRS